MPIYAYRCADCGHAKDVLQKMSDPPLTECPACGAHRFEKQVTAAGFQLKGSGWYVTDFRNNNSSSKSDKPADKPAEKAGEKAGEASRESAGEKPATAPAASAETSAPAAAPAASPAPASSTTS